MTDVRRRALLLLLAVAILLAIPALVRWNRARAAMPKDAVLVEIPEAPRWWRAMVNVCLGDPTPYPTSARYYAGRTIPDSWMTAGEIGHRTFGGYTDLATGRVILLPALAHDSSYVIHEALHVALGGGHPVRIYPTRTTARCGLAPAER